MLNVLLKSANIRMLLSFLALSAVTVGCNDGISQAGSSDSLKTGTAAAPVQTYRFLRGKDPQTFCIVKASRMADIRGAGAPAAKDCQREGSLSKALKSVKKNINSNHPMYSFNNYPLIAQSVSPTGVYETPQEMLVQFSQNHPRQVEIINNRMKKDEQDIGIWQQTLVDYAERWISDCTRKLLEAADTEGGILFDFGGSNGPSRVESEDYFFNGDFTFKTCPTRFQISKIMAFTVER